MGHSRESNWPGELPKKASIMWPVESNFLFPCITQTKDVQVLGKLLRERSELSYQLLYIKWGFNHSEATHAREI